MLLGIHPLLTGELLAGLDAMGHSDTVVIADAHFPAARLARLGGPTGLGSPGRCLDMPGVTTPELLQAICTVLPLDDAPALDLMESADRTILPVQHELMAAARLTTASTRFVDRFEFYDDASAAPLVIRTGETRVYGNALVRKGVVPNPAPRVQTDGES